MGGAGVGASAGAGESGETGVGGGGDVNSDIRGEESSRSQLKPAHDNHSADALPPPPPTAVATATTTAQQPPPPLPPSHPTGADGTDGAPRKGDRNGDGGGDGDDALSSFDLKVVYKAGRTGFEETKDFTARPQTIIAGTLCVCVRVRVGVWVGGWCFSQPTSTHRTPNS